MRANTLSFFVLLDFAKKTSPFMKRDGDAWGINNRDVGLIVLTVRQTGYPTG